MELVRRRGSASRFPIELFQKQQDTHGMQEWDSLEDLQRAANGVSGATIEGHIGKDTAEKWVGWAARMWVFATWRVLRSNWRGQ